MLVLLAAAAAAWLLQSRIGDHGRVHPLPWRDLTAQAGKLFLTDSETREFASRPQLQEYLQHANGWTVPKVDFPAWRAVAITLGPRSTTGYKLRVLSVGEDDDRVVITVRRTSATLAHPGRPELTFPYALITLPATGKRIHLEFAK